jgi:hypothetical protein
MIDLLEVQAAVLRDLCRRNAGCSINRVQGGPSLLQASNNTRLNTRTWIWERFAETLWFDGVETRMMLKLIMQHGYSLLEVNCVSRCEHPPEL